MRMKVWRSHGFRLCLVKWLAEWKVTLTGKWINGRLLLGWHMQTSLHFLLLWHCDKNAFFNVSNPLLCMITNKSSETLIKSKSLRLWSTFSLRLWWPSRFRANDIQHEKALIKSTWWLKCQLITARQLKRFTMNTRDTGCHKHLAGPQFSRLVAGNLMALHFFSSSSHNKYSPFCTCLDSDQGERWVGWGGGAWRRGTDIRFKEQTSMTALWNKRCPLLLSGN